MSSTIDFSEQDVDLFIEKVAESGVLGRSKRRLRLLSHLVRSEMMGEGQSLKAYSIGLDIFGKPSEFDPSTDSVVRVEMGRLRASLLLFEASEHATTRIKVDIPVGTYRPVISVRDAFQVPDNDTPTGYTSQADPRPDQSGLLKILSIGMGFAVVLIVGVALFLWQQGTSTKPTIGVQINAVAGQDNQARSVRSALTSALSRSQTIRLLNPPSENTTHKDATFIVSAEITEDDADRQVVTTLSDAETNRLIWVRSLLVPIDANLNDTINQHVTRELRIRLFGASKDILETIDPKELSPEALFVRATWVPGVAQSAISWEQKRIEFAQLALEGDPEFGAAHSVLADKLAYLANVYAPANTSENLDAARAHAERAVDLSPLDPDVMFNVAQSHWHSGRISESQATMGRVLELDPGHDLARFLNKVIPYTCAVATDEVLEEVLAFDRDLSPDNPIRWLTLTWIGWLHAYREEWDAALEAEQAAARIFQIPYTFMRHAMVLNQLGRTEEAKERITSGGRNWLEFESTHFITTTIPRLCSETPDDAVFVGYYSALLDSIKALSSD